MPKVYQAYYKTKEGTCKTHNGSRTLILAEARQMAKELGKEVVIDILELEKPSFKYLVELMNGKRPNKRTRLCSFVPKGQPVVAMVNGIATKRWKVKKLD